MKRITDGNVFDLVKSHDVHIDAEYVNWIAEVKHRYRSAQVKAAVRVNAEKLFFNWQLGRDLVQKKAEERRGAGVVEQVSLDLQREFPDAQQKLYQLGREILQRPVAEFIDEKLQQPVREIINNEKLHQVGGEFPQFFALVPWGQHIVIISKCKFIDEALFYVRKAIEQGLSRDALVNCIKANLYAHQGKIVSNFQEQLPQLQSRLVQEVLKENYDFGFATVGHEIYEERELEEALHTNITAMLLELGNGFAFIGRQKEILVGDRYRKIDLLFYHIRLRCYVVCELKAKAFEPEFAGKLNYYVNAVDDVLKQYDDNPTIGLLICSDMNKADVQWSFKGISTPIGVATYNNIRIKDVLPTQEQLKERMELLQKELRETKRLITNDQTGRNMRPV